MYAVMFGAKSILLEGRGFVKMSNVAFVELPKGLIERDTISPVSCLVI